MHSSRHHISINTASKSSASTTAKNPAWIYSQHLSTATHIGSITLLIFAALIPRIMLALQLDIVTDEVVYILGGKKYLPLLTHITTSLGSKEWLYNNEHPPLVKMLIGIFIGCNKALGLPLSELFAARLPSIVMGTLLILAIYWLGRAPFGRLSAFLAALCLAFSPWLVYFSALAYLDITMTTLISMAYLLLWHALRKPWLYPIAAILVGLGADSKYTAVLVIPAMVLFIGYYFLFIRPKLPTVQRPQVPWSWWLLALLLAPLAFLTTDPAIWTHPLSLLLKSFAYEWAHSIHGHRTFLAGEYAAHVPHWAILYIAITKISAFVTIPAVFFIIFAVIQLIRFQWHDAKVSPTDAITLAFVLIWLVGILGMFSLLNIVVGTHYDLPVTPPLVLAGTLGLGTLLRYQRGQSGKKALLFPESSVTLYSRQHATMRRFSRRTIFTVTALAIALVVPHLVGLITVHAAEGYTSEFFPDENNTLQVAYPGYRDALQWLAAHHKGEHLRVGLAAFPNTLAGGGEGVSWYNYNSDLAEQFQLAEAHPNARAFPYDYLIWPMHLVQRGYAIPEPWRDHVVHTVRGGDTVYCYLTTHTPTKKP